ncbi:RpiB/LacA/LacB family sugar-phosphate isomerase [[Mycoplasma] testudinis]|uniref:RpiB/LacA/LacB family sugar-phosphate isomerase n=1 Tax=[Mycoplasma] testudinis TaxID=33924 RepID=UPI00047F10B7|nr:RpiB/LacA/LacB family sugar-phosphate isomerase [[Mycoplasma] testudinis]
MTSKKPSLPVIYFGADHTGFTVKNSLITWLQKKGYQVEDLGNNVEDPADDYPLYGFAVAKAVASHQNAVGITICGTGVGICIAANKIKGARAALVYDPKIADLAVRHDNANILSLAARQTSLKKMQSIITIFLNSKFEKGRHSRRVNQIIKQEEKTGL